MEDILKRKEGESDEKYIFRMYKNKDDYNLTNKEVHSIICQQLGLNIAESSLRCKWTNYIEGYDVGYEQGLNENENVNKEDIEKNQNFNYKETIEMMQDGSYKSDKLLKMNNEQCKDPNFLLKSHGFDRGYWQITSAKNNIWNVYSQQDGVQQLYSSKITVKPIIKEFDEEWIKDTISNLQIKNNIIEQYDYENNENGKIVEINFCDVHMGKVVNELVSNGVYDTDLAIKRFNGAMNEAISKSLLFPIKEYIFVVGQDYMNIDCIEGTTHAGTKQDMNEFYESIYKKALESLILNVEKLRKIAPIKIIYVKGNHDTQTTFSMVCALEQMYKNMGIKDVQVDSGLKQRKYVTFGDVVIGFGHGEKEGKRIFDCMQNDVKEYWHKNKKYFHLSHKHRESKQEQAGVIYQWLGCLSENCNWTWSSGFVGSEKKGHMFIYDDLRGLECEFFIKA